MLFFSVFLTMRLSTSAPRRQPGAAALALGVGVMAPSAAIAAERPSLHDAETTSVLVVGYSTSYAWPDILQDMLDDHFGGRRRHHVLNAVVGGAPVEHWIADPGTRHHERTIGAMRRDFLGADARLRGGAPAPSIAICQQSLQLTRDDRGPVKSAHDMVGAEMGADALETMALRLRDEGLEHVFIAMHIYKEPVEPEVGNERIALARLLQRGHEFIHEGPDVWTPTRDAFPECFEEDRLHPNEQGMKIMAEGWYRALTGDDARSAVIERMRRRDYDVDRMMRDYLAWRRGEGPARPNYVARAKRFRTALEAEDYGAAQAMMADDARRWFDERSGPGRPWRVGPGIEAGPWAAWDEHFDKRTEPIRWEPGDRSATNVFRETNDYFLLLERGWVETHVTYFFNDAGRIDGMLIHTGDAPRPPGRTNEFLTWAQDHAPAELAELMPNGSIDPAGDHPQRFRRLLNRWRRDVGLPEIW